MESSYTGLGFKALSTNLAYKFPSEIWTIIQSSSNEIL